MGIVMVEYNKEGGLSKIISYISSNILGLNFFMFDGYYSTYWEGH